MMTNPTLKSRADVHFKIRELQKADAPLARAEYEAAGVAMREKTERLRALRMSRDAALSANPPAKKKAAKR